MIQVPFSKPVAFYPVFAQTFGGINEAIFMQQLLYWSDKGAREDGYIYKTKKEWEEETYLTRDKQDRIVEKFKQLGYLETALIKVSGAPILHYKVVIGLVEKALMDKRETRLSKSGKPAKPPITESTTESTSSSKAEPCNGNGTLIPLVIKEMEAIDPKNKRFYGNKTQREACDFLINEYGLDLVMQVIHAIPHLKAKLPYMPSVTTPVELLDKWVKIRDAIGREKAKAPEVLSM